MIPRSARLRAAPDGVDLLKLKSRVSLARAYMRRLALPRLESASYLPEVIDPCTVIGP